MKNSKKIREIAKNIEDKLRVMGVRWEMEHIRPMRQFVALTPEGPDKILSRADFGRAVEELQYKAPAGIPTAYGNFVGSTGGYTLLTLQKPNGEVVVSKHNFSAHENYFKALGFMKAAFKSGIFCKDREEV